MKSIGVDIGGTTIKGALFERGIIVARAEVPTRAEGGREAISNNLFTVIDRLVSDDTACIGVASAGNINPATGEVVFATDNLTGWTGVNIKKIVEERYHIPCSVENDAIAALIAELSVCAESQNVTMLTFGTGIGGASLVNGQILRGKRFDAGRWGHVCIESGGLQCNCGCCGCAEQYLSATALVKTARTQQAADSAQELFLLFAKGDKRATIILEQWAKRLDALLCTIENSIAPDLIILGGGVMRSFELVKKLLGKNHQSIVKAAMDSDAGIAGANKLGLIEERI